MTPSAHTGPGTREDIDRQAAEARWMAQSRSRTYLAAGTVAGRPQCDNLSPAARGVS